VDINMIAEAKTLAEKLDEAFDAVIEEFDADFTTRQYSDWITKYGLTDNSAAEFGNVIDAIMFEALEKVTNRWKETGKLPK